MDKILNNTNPTIQEIKNWAYDEDLYFIEQDEDLVLHQPKYIPILIELASDQVCPKGDYCLSILSYYTQLLLANRMLEELTEVEKQINEYARPMPEKINKWKSNFLLLNDLIKTPREITESEADDVAFRLAVGNTLRNFKKLGHVDNQFIEYCAYTMSYK